MVLQNSCHILGGITNLYFIYKSGFMFCSTHVGNFSSNPGKVHFGELVQLLIYIRDRRNLFLGYYSKIEDAAYQPIGELISKYLYIIIYVVHLLIQSQWSYKIVAIFWGGLLTYILSTRVDLCFAVHMLAIFHQILVKSTLGNWYNCWYILGTEGICSWDIIPR